MCGRTALTAKPEDLREIFGLTEEPRIVPHYNVTPSQPLAVVRVVRGATGRTLESLRWGLVPFWADDPKMGHKLALARVETVATSPAFRDAVRKHRCLVVVDGFYEWKRDGNGKTSQPFLIREGNGHPFALGGVWSTCTTKDGEVVDSVAILTCPPRPPVDTIHDRMPLVIPRDGYTRWLRPDADVVDLLTPSESDLVAIPVSTLVNSPNNDDPRCIEPAPVMQPTLFG